MVLRKALINRHFGFLSTYLVGLLSLPLNHVSFGKRDSSFGHRMLALLSFLHDNLAVKSCIGLNRLHPWSSDLSRLADSPLMVADLSVWIVILILLILHIVLIITVAEFTLLSKHAVLHHTSVTRIFNLLVNLLITLDTNILLLLEILSWHHNLSIGAEVIIIVALAKLPRAAFMAHPFRPIAVMIALLLAVELLALDIT